MQIYYCGVLIGLFVISDFGIKTGKQNDKMGKF